MSSGRLAFASPTLLSICPLPWEPGLSPTTIIVHACLFSVGSLCFNEDVLRVSVGSLHCFCVMRYRWNTASRRPSSAGGASGTSVLIRYYGSSRRNGGEIRCAIFSSADDWISIQFGASPLFARSHRNYECPRAQATGGRVGCGEQRGGVWLGAGVR